MIEKKEILEILPREIKNQLNAFNFKNIQEIRIRAEKPIIVKEGSNEVITNYMATLEDISSIVKRMSSYSIYAYDDEIKQGYITIKGGHRVGICGKCVLDGEKVKTIKYPASLNIRICREVEGCSNKILPYVLKSSMVENTIIISPPNCGKTTLLRDIAKNLSNGIKKLNLRGMKVCVIDERSEIASCVNGVPQLNIGLRTDVLDSCPKSQGIMMAIRSMSPEVIVCDEIGSREDIESIIKAMNSGVKLITTVHGYDVEDIYEREVFKEAIENKVFQKAIVLSGRKGVGTVEYIYSFEEKNIIYKD
ncbi:stage III sporulation protein AA [Clostridium cochlearium]|uniref:Stage III sporulation protein AA n=1 Tax=Clostridium cochlearium TaxID=1494 RepID=A0ABY0QKM6_CLOCO|nr:stage III sporulation protein AA [Clostridium cochlearium]MBE6065344.1 stage III sporulation protein AA [Clostridium cochlearium]MCR1970417.1 stage III sporulation protein AA [Clostridium cochlearium]MDU1443761.1 stage III sporulation protein AA [Clostridium cochlearium]SDL07800.1 stage III sporulation protein AA [Clostridium cochlearium]SNV79800.1 stage III sporulation protein AA [Clostridium cochlearium]